MNSIHDGYAVHAKYYHIYPRRPPPQARDVRFAYGYAPTRAPPPKQKRVLVRRKSIWESPHSHLDAAVVTQELHVGSIDFHTTFLTLVEVLVPAERGETPVL